MIFPPKQDLWQYLQQTKKTVVLYGMGNGADKILNICGRFGIEIADFFASDGFVRGHSFHGKTVLSYSQIKEKYGKENLIVLLSFASSLPSVLSLIDSVAAECELYAPDVPVCGDNLFNMEFARAHREELLKAYDLLADEESKKIYENVIAYKLTGRIDYLRQRTAKGQEHDQIVFPVFLLDLRIAQHGFPVKAVSPYEAVAGKEIGDRDAKASANIQNFIGAVAHAVENNGLFRLLQVLPKILLRGKIHGLSLTFYVVCDMIESYSCIIT